MSISNEERLLWVLAEEFENSVTSFHAKVTDKIEWVDSIDEAESLASRMRGTFIASLVGEVEEKIGRNFTSVFNQLSGSPTTRMSDYWFVQMPASSSASGRAKVMWAIRIAYTHGNGHVSQIDDPKVRKWIEHNFSALHFDGVKVENDVATLLDGVTFPAMKTALEIIDKFR